MKRIWLVGLALVMALVPSGVAWARPVSAYSITVDVVPQLGAWGGHVEVVTDELGFANVGLDLSRMTLVACSPGEPGLIVEHVIIASNVTGAATVDRKLAAASYTTPDVAEYSVVDGCTRSTTSTAVHLAVSAVATGDLTRGRTADGRLLVRVSDISVTAGPASVSESGLVSELITKG